MLRWCLLHVCLMPIERLAGRSVPPERVYCVSAAHPVLLLGELGEGLGNLCLQSRLGGLRGASQGQFGIGVRYMACPVSKVIGGAQGVALDRYLWVGLRLSHQGAGSLHHGLLLLLKLLLT